MNNEVKIVPFSDCFTPELIEVYKDAYRGLERYTDTEDKKIEDYFLWLRTRDPKGVFVALLDGRPVGMVAVDSNWVSYREMKNVGEIHEIFVKSGLKHRGVGKMLMNSAMKYLEDKGLDTFELWAGKTNEAAIKFYEKLGFRIEGRWGKWVRMVKMCS
jgi:ribosomal protein S18 acetylase RimI-like enzyme